MRGGWRSADRPAPRSARSVAGFACAVVLLVPGPVGAQGTGGDSATRPGSATGGTRVDILDDLGDIAAVGAGGRPAGGRGESSPGGFFRVARASIFGPSDYAPWRPLSLRTLFTEGWDEPWIAPPDGSGGAPRQGWIGAADGNFYRLYWASYIENFHVVQGGNGYVSRFNLYTPLSRRLLLITTVPDVNSNSPSFNLGTTDFASGGAATNRSTGRGTSFGDLTFTPRVMLAEGRDSSLSAQLAIQIPTGSTRSGAGQAILTPGVQLWEDIGRGWAIRGGFNVAQGVNRPGLGTTLLSQLAVGRTITPHDTPILGDLTYYLALNDSNQVATRALTTVTLAPGFRAHLGDDWYLLGSLSVPVTGPHPYDESVTVWLMKTF